MRSCQDKYRTLLTKLRCNAAAIVDVPHKPSCPGGFSSGGTNAHHHRSGNASARARPVGTSRWGSGLGRLGERPKGSLRRRSCAGRDGTSRGPRASFENQRSLRRSCRRGRALLSSRVARAGSVDEGSCLSGTVSDSLAQGSSPTCTRFRRRNEASSGSGARGFFGAGLIDSRLVQLAGTLARSAAAFPCATSLRRLVATMRVRNDEK